VHKGFAAARTLLLPGFRYTPEHNVLRATRIKDRAKKRDLYARAEKQGSNGTRFDFELLKWFHDHGVAQVKTFDNQDRGTDAI
jgi:hypothetical protein